MNNTFTSRVLVDKARLFFFFVSPAAITSNKKRHIYTDVKRPEQEERGHGAKMNRRTTNHGHGAGNKMMGLVENIWAWSLGPGRQLATTYGLRALNRLRSNLARRRLLSFPHLVVGIWVLIVLYGELWVFDSKVADCHWDHWEKWVGPTKTTPCVSKSSDSVI